MNTIGNNESDNKKPDNEISDNEKSNNGNTADDYKDGAVTKNALQYHSTVAPVLSASSRSSVNASHPSKPSSSSRPFSSLE